MKREDVKNKIPGITEEQLNWLMQENGSDIIREKFLSTLSLRRATFGGARPPRADRDFYPRSPCGERLPSFSSSAARVYFYPRSPCGERQKHKKMSRQRGYFYPRSPCGERLRQGSLTLSAPIFLSTLSLRRAT